VFPKIFLLHKVVRDAKKVEKHCARECQHILKKNLCPLVKLCKSMFPILTWLWLWQDVTVKINSPMWCIPTACAIFSFWAECSYYSAFYFLPLQFRKYTYLFCCYFNMYISPPHSASSTSFASY